MSGFVVQAKVSLIMSIRPLVVTVSISGMPLLVEAVSELDHIASNEAHAPSLLYADANSAIIPVRPL